MSNTEAQVLKQFEFYFGDSNLPGDTFLKQLVGKSEQGCKYLVFVLMGSLISLVFGSAISYLHSVVGLFSILAASQRAKFQKISTSSAKSRHFSYQLVSFLIILFIWDCMCLWNRCWNFLCNLSSCWWHMSLLLLSRSILWILLRQTSNPTIAFGFGLSLFSCFLSILHLIHTLHSLLKYQPIFMPLSHNTNRGPNPDHHGLQQNEENHHWYGTCCKGSFWVQDASTLWG